MDQANVGNMNAYYGRQFSVEEMQRVSEMDTQDAMMGFMGTTGMDAAAMMGGQSLDEIIRQNNNELERRRTSYHESQPFSPGRIAPEHNPRGASMMEFGTGNSNDLEGFQFDPFSVQPPSGIHRSLSTAQRGVGGQRPRRRQSPENLALNTQFQEMPSSYSQLSSSSPYPQSALHQNDSINLDMSTNYMDNNMLVGSMDFSSGGLERNHNNDVATMNLFSQTHFPPDLTASPLQQDMPSSIRSSTQDPGGGPAHAVADPSVNKGNQLQMPDQISELSVNMTQPSNQVQDTGSTTELGDLPDFVEPPQSQPSKPANLDSSAGADPPQSTGDGMGAQSITPQYKNAYSASGFDMLGVLMRVASRPKPQINIGAVDMSCAFVVCDVTQHDIPIVYCSDIFGRLTGYTKHEILGRNCRFLQAPDGKIQAGIKRKYVDDQSVWRIKKMITARQEMQISVINYRKGGQPFMNLLTMIPIAWDTDEIKFYVGFQVDLVEQPTSIINKNPGKPNLCPCACGGH